MSATVSTPGDRLAVGPASRPPAAGRRAVVVDHRLDHEVRES